MSLMIPGPGHYENGDTGKALIQDLWFVGGIVLAAGGSESPPPQKLIGGSLAVGTVAWSVIDAPIPTRRKNKQQAQASSEFHGNADPSSGTMIIQPHTNNQEVSLAVTYFF